ncbi:MAG: VWA domain-containing protein [Myxococcota bacterium]
MPRTLIVATGLALAGLAAFIAPPAQSARGVTDKLVVREQCFERPADDLQAVSGLRNGRGSRAGGGKAKPKSGALSPSPPPPQEKRSRDGADEADESVQEAEAEPMKESLGRLDRDDVADQSQPRATSLDWGATIYLSNDDSMSLASAQRVLYQAMNGRTPSFSEIRPHELLNYFSFDTVTPDPERRFDVLASGRADGETLTVALAVKGATPARRPLDLTLLVDRSGSMAADGRMAFLRRGLLRMRDQLVEGDRIDLVVFDHQPCTPLENFVVGRDPEGLLTRMITAIEPAGSTDLNAGLQEAYRVAKEHRSNARRNRRVMVLTDALLNTGDVNPATVTEVGRSFERDGIRITGVGVGRDFNDDVLDRLTEKGKGAYVYLGSEAVVDRLFGSAGFASLTQTIAHDVQFALHLPDSLAMERFYGEEASTRAEDIQPLNYYAGTSQLFLQELRMRGAPQRNDVIRLEIKYRNAETGEPERRSFKTTVGRMLDSSSHNVDKGLALMAWTDMLTAQALGNNPCGDTLRTYARRAAQLPEDAEIAFVTNLVRNQCGPFELPSSNGDQGRVKYKVRVDADQPIAAVSLSCRGDRLRESLDGGSTVANFDSIPGTCDLTLVGRFEMRTQVEVPETGGSTRCVVRGGRLRCS